MLPKEGELLTMGLNAEAFTLSLLVIGIYCIGGQLQTNAIPKRRQGKPLFVLVWLTWDFKQRFAELAFVIYTRGFPQSSYNMPMLKCGI